MPKRSAMIYIDSNAFRDMIQSKETLSSLGSKLGVTRQALNAWLSGNKIPPSKLSKAASILNLSEKDISNLTFKKRPEANILFRTNRNVEVSESVKENVLEVARDYFKLDEICSLKKNNKLVKLNDERPPELLAQDILSFLGIDKRESLTLDYVLSSLKALDIHVLFYDFGEEFIQNNGQAVCVREGEKSVIFINSQEFVVDVLWRISHELCHLLCRHESPSKKIEEYCNAVATEVVTPRSFFETHEEELKTFFNPKRSDLRIALNEICSYLNASPMGVIISLQKHQVIPARTIKLLWGIYHKKIKNQQLRVHDLLQVPSDTDPVEHWKNIIDDTDRQKYLHLQSLVKRGLILGKISFERASELMGIDIMSAQQLAEAWRREYSYEGNY